LLALLGIVWIADSAAYFAGRGFGRRKLAPEISPGKTWEGVIGAGIAVAVYYALLRFAFAPATAWLGGAAGILLCGAITVMSIEGDLFESWMKRQAAMKDSGSLLPGHGGVLDRIDGLTASMPLAALASFYLG
jgi:phosphatidate cytidylyltransferase